MDSIAKKTLVHVPWYTPVHMFPWGYTREWNRYRLCRSPTYIMTNCFQSGCTNLNTTNGIWVFIVSHFCQHLILSDFFSFCLSGRCEIVIYYDFNFQYSESSWGWAFVRCWLAKDILFCKVPVQASCWDFHWVTSSFCIDIRNTLIS